MLRTGIVVLGAVGALVFVAPTVLVLASFVGLVHFDMNMLLVALPALAAAVTLALFARGTLSDLLLPRPVLSIDDDGILDRRVMTERLPWTEVTRATSILSGGGGLVLELRNPIPTIGMGTLAYEMPDRGAAHVALRGMTVPAQTLARAALDAAARAGAETAEARTHDRVRRRQWTV